MSTWRIRPQRLDQTGLANELATWLTKVSKGVFLYREGPTLSEFQWGNTHDVSMAELSRTWIIRLFCLEFEIYARRIDYDEVQAWQVRIAAAEHLQAEGEALTKLDEQRLLMLGEATGDGENFVQKQFRYRRAKLRYPGHWQQREKCGLWMRRYQPREGGSIVCWQKLSAVEL